MKKTILYFITLLSISYLHGQNNSFYNIEVPNFTLKSPEVKAIERYGEIPVSEYTGTPSIDIPIHVVEEGSISLPISLNYHATGIQVTQEATWVGLGWNLLAGGCISLIPVGPIDQNSPVYCSVTDWQKIINYTPSYFSYGYPRRDPEPTGTANLNCVCLWGGTTQNENMSAINNSSFPPSLKSDQIKHAIF